MALKYPLTLDGKYNYIRFTAYKPSQGGDAAVDSAHLYCPPSINFADSASYNQFDMGVLGASQFSDNINQTLNGGGAEALANLGEDFRAVGQSGTINNILGAQVLQSAGLGTGLAGKAKDIYLQRKGRAINPNTVTQFTNTAIRNFSFTWKLMADSQKESNEIQRITEFFQENMYPDSDAGGLLLTYPSKFRIFFMTPSGENDYIPKIAECYLTNTQTVFNASTNIFFDNGAPSEVDLTLTFQETRALTRNDLKELKNRVST